MADKGKELLGKVRIESAECSLMPQTCDLLCFPSGIARWQTLLGLQLADCVGAPEPFSQQANDRGIDVIDVIPEVAKVGNGITRMCEHSNQTPRCIWNHSIAAASVRRLPWWEWPRSVA